MSDADAEFVVSACIESRSFTPESLQAAWLRDTILTRLDPLMMITQRLKKAKVGTAAESERKV